MTTINESKKKSAWDQALHVSAILSEVANIGIVIEIVAKWWPALLTIGRGFFSYIVFYSDPIIYCFKSLNRLTRIIGRTFFNIAFDEEKNGVHPQQTAADILSLSFYLLSILCFFGVIISGPVGVTLGWTSALCGLCVVGFFDYRHQKERAWKNYARSEANCIILQAHCKNSPTPEQQAALKASEKERNTLAKEYQNKKTSYWLYMGLLFGLACLLICGSAVPFASPALAPILFIVSKIASGYLGVIAIGRFCNWVKSAKKEDDKPADTALEIKAEPEGQESSMAALSKLQTHVETVAACAAAAAPVHSQIFHSAESPARECPSSNLSLSGFN